MTTQTKSEPLPAQLPATAPSFVLAFECPNRIGLVRTVAGHLADHGCDIIDSHQFDDHVNNRFFMRVQALHPADFDLEKFREEFSVTADELEMNWHLQTQGQRMRTLIMVTGTDHCLNELLDLWRSGLLNIEITAIAGNHETLRPIAESHGLAFHHIPVTKDTKEEAEQQLLKLISDTETELVVLARYMQILSDDFCTRFPGQIINIHHSFLPGFKGASPYRQAFDRGVKMIGATAHYVTSDLESVLDVDHRARPEDLAIAGRRAERVALARAVQWHCERRIFLNGHRTVIFD